MMMPWLIMHQVYEMFDWFAGGGFRCSSALCLLVYDSVNWHQTWTDGRISQPLWVCDGYLYKAKLPTSVCIGQLSMSSDGSVVLKPVIIDSWSGTCVTSGVGLGVTMWCSCSRHDDKNKFPKIEVVIQWRILIVCHCCWFFVVFRQS